MLNFLFAFFLEISEILKAHISGTETDVKGKKPPSQFSTVVHIATKNIIKIFDA